MITSCAFLTLKHITCAPPRSEYGHVGADLITLASMLRIPVTMHNVSLDALSVPMIRKLRIMLPVDSMARFTDKGDNRVKRTVVTADS